MKIRKNHLLYQFPIEKQQTVGADPRVRPLWAHTWMCPYKNTLLARFSPAGRRQLATVNSNAKGSTYVSG
jgi:hypothetical protein